MRSDDTMEFEQLLRTVARVQRDQIEIRAYQIYVSRGRIQGRGLEDWLQAEREVIAFASSGRPALFHESREA